jgi:hypothetical protein
MGCLLKIIGLLLPIAFFIVYAIYANEVKDNPYGIKAYSQTEVDSIIDNHPYTIIFAWHLGCGPCRMYLENDVIPYMSVKPDTIGFISITPSNYNQVVRFMEKHSAKVPTFIYEDTITNQYLGFYHYWLPSILPNYEHQVSEGVPHTIVCNNKREILNIDDSKFAFDAQGDTIWKEGVRYYFINWCIEHFDEIISR